MLALLVAVSIAPQVTLKLEAGTELDTNVHRTDREAASPVEGYDGRIAARLGAAARPGAGLLRLSALAAAKIFAGDEASSENVGVLAGDARWDVAAGDLAPGVRLSYYDASEAATTSEGAGLDHAFRTGDAAAALTLRTEDDHRIEATAGYRFFTYKPDHDFDFTGAHIGLALSRKLRFADGKSEIAYAASYALSERAYDGPALATLCPAGAPITTTCLLVTTLARADLFHDAAIDLSYTGAFILGARYELQINDSNSFGQSLVRHRVELSSTVELGWDVFLNAKVVLIVNQFLDALLLGGDVGTFTTIEDEARNALVIHATRDLGEAWMIEARYALYLNPFATQELAYRRQTFYLGVVYSFGR